MQYGLRSRRSRVLYRTTAFLVAFFVICGAAIYLYYWQSQNNQMEKSIDETIRLEVDNLTAAYDYYWEHIIDQVYADLLEEQLERDPDFLANMEGIYLESYLDRKQTPDQEFFNEEFADIVKGGLLGMKYLFSVVMPSDIVIEPAVTASSEQSMVYSWEVPDGMVRAIEEGDGSKYLPGGVPELGLAAASLLYIRVEPFRELHSEYAIVVVSDISEQVSAIQDFYHEERNNAVLVFGIIMAAAIFLLSLISYFFLRHMIRKHITEPIDYLSSVAEEVMQGNLDVEVEVTQGEDFEGLKRAFREMTEALRDMIDKSTRQ